MRISENGIDLIASFEGLRTNAYRCPANVITIGIGETGKLALTGEKLYMGMTITEQQAKDSFRIAIKRYENTVNDLGVQFTQNQFDALVSFCYNLGTGIFKGSLLTSIKAKNWTSVASQMLLYNKARVNGKLTVLKGLDRRRKAEVALFNKECDDEVVKKIKVKVNGVVKEVYAINNGGNNYVKLQDLNDSKIEIGYNGMPVITTK